MLLCEHMLAIHCKNELVNHLKSVKMTLFLMNFLLQDYCNLLYAQPRCLLCLSNLIRYTVESPIKDTPN